MSGNNSSSTFHIVLRPDRRKGGEKSVAKAFTLRLDDAKPIRIGRGSANDVVVASKAVSLFHAELRVLKLGKESEPRVCIRDLSMNGSGLRLPKVKHEPHGGTLHLSKGKDEPLEHGSTILVPMMLKVTQSSSDRAWLKIEFKKSAEEARQAVKKDPDVDVVAKKAGNKEHAKKPASKPRRSTLRHQDEEKLEELRTNFVELLLQTRQIDHDTPYEDAAKMMKDSEDWNALDESTRKECYEIFVGHLASTVPKPRKKKKVGDQKKAKNRQASVPPEDRKRRADRFRSRSRREARRVEKRKRHCSRSDGN